MRFRSVLLLLASVPLCSCLENLERGGELVTVFATHHASPENNSFPDRGADMAPRIFEGEDGWEITLAETYVTIAATTLVSCGGSEQELRMFWGPCPEDLRGEDLGILTVSGLKVPPGDYCELRVRYAPYVNPVVDDETETRHVVPANDEVEGSTVFIRGIAKRGEDESVPFQLETDAEFTVSVDLSEIEGEGNPLTISKGQNFPKELTISKTYDRFFDGVDWATFDEAAAEELEDNIEDVLDDQTRVAEGQRILPELYED